MVAVVFAARQAVGYQEHMFAWTPAQRRSRPTNVARIIRRPGAKRIMTPMAISGPKIWYSRMVSSAEILDSRRTLVDACPLRVPLNLPAGSCDVLTLHNGALATKHATDGVDTPVRGSPWTTTTRTTMD